MRQYKKEKIKGIKLIVFTIIKVMQFKVLVILVMKLIVVFLIKAKVHVIQILAE